MCSRWLNGRAVGTAGLVGTLALVLTLSACGGSPGVVPAVPSPSTAHAKATAPALGSVVVACGTPASGSPRYLFTIQSDQSRATYTAHDSLFNHLVVGTTSSGVKGQFLVTAGAAPALDTLTVSVGLDAVHTDSGQRDADVDSNVLDTDHYPLATFVYAGAQPISATYATGADVSFDLAGTLTLHARSHPETLHVHGRLSGQTITGAGGGSIQMSDFGINAPNIAGIVRVDDALAIGVTFTATAEVCA